MSTVVKARETPDQEGVESLTFFRLFNLVNRNDADFRVPDAENPAAVQVPFNRHRYY